MHAHSLRVNNGHRIGAGPHFAGAGGVVSGGGMFADEGVNLRHFTRMIIKSWTDNNSPVLRSDNLLQEPAPHPGTRQMLSVKFLDARNSEKIQLFLGKKMISQKKFFRFILGIFIISEKFRNKTLPCVRHFALEIFGSEVRASMIKNWIFGPFSSRFEFCVFRV